MPLKLLLPYEGRVSEILSVACNRCELNVEKSRQLWWLVDAIWFFALIEISYAQLSRMGRHLPCKQARK